MNIYVCLFIEQEDSLWHHHLTGTLCKMGHRVFIPTQLGLQESWYLISQALWTRNNRQELTEKILVDVKLKNKEFGINLFFCYLFPCQFTPILFKELTKLGIPSVYFFPDNLSYRVVARDYAPFATLNWVTETRAIRYFEDSKSNFLYLPMAANPDINYPLDVDEIIDISFVGLKTPHRRETLGRVAKSGLDLRIYGNGWHANKKITKKDRQRYGRDIKSGFINELFIQMQLQERRIIATIKYLLTLKRQYKYKMYNKRGKEYETTLEAMVNKEPLFDVCRVRPANLLDLIEVNKIYSLSSVSIGLNDQFNEYDGLFTHTNLRNFEAAMSGACYLTEATAEINELFLEGKEIMVFHDADELIDKAKFLLKKTSFRKELRLACRKRALSEHTWEHRFNRIFSLLRLAR